MATLTDEEKAKAIIGDVEDESPAEPTEKPEAPTEPEEQPEPEAEDSEEEKLPESESEPEEESSFTKQFPNLKGDTLEEYVPELEKAYDNSFKEALRLKKELDDNAALVDQAKQIIAQASAPVTTPPATPPTQTAVQPAAQLDTIDQHPAIQYARAKQTEDMMAAFDEFKKEYPQTLEEQNFQAFTKASDGINAALTATLGRAPTYRELFPAIAGSLGWQATTTQARKDAAIKENASSGRLPGSQSPAPSKAPKVSEDQIAAYMKMFTSKTREEALKELSEVV